MSKAYPRVSTFKTAERFRARLADLGVDLPCDDEIQTASESPLARPLEGFSAPIGNRWAIHPMEGWDGTREGLPTEHTLRRWRNFGLSGAKLVWGGEAVAVRHDGRANPNQLLIHEKNLPGLEQLRTTLVEAHREKTGTTDDLYVGLQLTHSGRYSRPDADAPIQPRVLYRHPILDRRVGIDSDEAVLADSEIEELIEDFVRAAKLSAKAGFRFVDIKHCHGYLGHEFLSAHTREGKFGGNFENRTRFLREVVAGIRDSVPGLEIGVRLSSFDYLPYRPNPEETSGKSLGGGIPEPFEEARYRYGFGVNPEDATRADFNEPIAFARLLGDLGIRLINVSAGSPYYNPHIQRPALFPPSDGYRPPEDPLVGVARLLAAARTIKEAVPSSIVVGTGFTYLQEFTPHVAQAMVREGWMDFAGLGRMVLSYPELPYDSLSTGKLERKKICRTFSECTTAPRNGIHSGCFPLDPYYKNSEAGERMRALKAGKVD